MEETNMNLPSLTVSKTWQPLTLDQGKYILQNKSTSNILLYEGVTPNDDDALILYPGRATNIVVTEDKIHIKSVIRSAQVAVVTG